MAKLRLKDFLKRCSTVNQGFKVYEEQYNGHSFVLCEKVNVSELMKMKSLLNRIVSGWDTFELLRPYGNLQLQVSVFPEGVSNHKELTLFCIKKHLKLMAKGNAVLDDEEVQCAAYMQKNIGVGYIWFVYMKKESKKEKYFHCLADDPRALLLVKVLEGKESEKYSFKRTEDGVVECKR